MSVAVIDGEVRHVLHSLINKMSDSSQNGEIIHSNFDDNKWKADSKDYSIKENIVRKEDKNVCVDFRKELITENTTLEQVIDKDVSNSSSKMLLVDDSIIKAANYNQNKNMDGCLSDIESPIKMRKKTSKVLLEDTDDILNTAEVNVKKDPVDTDSTSDIDSPIKYKKNMKLVINDSENTAVEQVVDYDPSNSTSNVLPEYVDDSINSPTSKYNQLDSFLSDNESPIKIRKKTSRILLEDTDDISNTNTAEIDEKKKAVDPDPTSDIDSPVKRKNILQPFSDDEADETDPLAKPYHQKEIVSSDLNQNFDIDSSTRLNEKISQHSVELEDFSIAHEIEDSHIFNQDMEDNFPDPLTENAMSDSGNESSPRKRNSFIRDAKGKDLVKQSLSLPYFQLPKPDFKKFIAETDKRLEKPLLEIMPKQNQNPKASKKITLKPANNIVFEIGMNKVEPFRKKVLNMMSRCDGVKPGNSDKTAGIQKGIPQPIGAERLSWKMKLLNDIARKKEAVLKERNEMLEEALEIDEEEKEGIESDNEDLMEDEPVDIHFPISETLMSAPDVYDQDDSLPELSVVSQSGNDNDKVDENNKEVESSPLCFSLPSFQPQGGFSEMEEASTANFSHASETMLSFNESESQKDNHSLSLFGSSNMVDSEPLPPISQNDEIVYDKVLAKENLLGSEHNISRDMITADVLDICSGQFPDEEEMPKTPPLMNLSGDEESNNYLSDDNCPSDHPPPEPDSDSEDDLKFKRKVLKKKIRPISPIDEESRYGEEDTQVHPASVLLEANSNFNFSKDISPHNTDSEDNDDDMDQLTHRSDFEDKDNGMEEINYNSEESLIDDKEKQQVSKTVRDFFENEAELSGEEGSSDEDEHDLDGEDPLVLDDADLPANEELRDQIGSLHLKHLLDDDDQMIKQVKNHFLDEGELYSDAARQRKFNWSFNQVEAVNNPNCSGSDEEEEINETPFHEDKLKWMQEKGNKENDEEVDQSFDASFKTPVRRRIATQIVADRSTNSFNKRPRNSFLDEEEAKKSFKKIKLDVTNAQGSRVTKNFVFAEANENGSVKRKFHSQKETHKSSIDNSVFDLI